MDGWWLCFLSRLHTYKSESLSEMKYLLKTRKQEIRNYQKWNAFDWKLESWKIESLSDIYWKLESRKSETWKNEMLLIESWKAGNQKPSEMKCFWLKAGKLENWKPLRNEISIEKKKAGNQKLLSHEMLLKAGKLEIRNSQKSSMLESWIAESNIYNCQTESPPTINYIFRQINILYYMFSKWLREINILYYMFSKWFRQINILYICILQNNVLKILNLFFVQSTTCIRYQIYLYYLYFDFCNSI